MPILENSIIRNDESNLPVALFLPENYMNTQNFGFGKHIGPDIKWADGKGSNLFKVKTKLQSTIYTQVGVLVFVCGGIHYLFSIHIVKGVMLTCMYVL